MNKGKLSIFKKQLEIFVLFIEDFNSFVEKNNYSQLQEKLNQNNNNNNQCQTPARVNKNFKLKCNKILDETYYNVNFEKIVSESNNHEILDDVQANNQNDIIEKSNTLSNNLINKSIVIQVDTSDEKINDKSTSKKETFKENQKPLNIQNISMQHSERSTDSKNQDRSLAELKHQIDSSTFNAIAISTDFKIVHCNQSVYDNIIIQQSKKLGNKDVQTIVPESEILILQMKFQELKFIDPNNANIEFSMLMLDKDMKADNQIINLTKYLCYDQEQQIMHLTKPEKEVYLIIDPKNQQYQYWLALVSFILIALVLQLPQDMVQNDSKTTDALEPILTVIFGIDILFNFNISFEEEGKIVKDRYLIATSQLQGYFLIDLVSTIPTSTLFDNFINTQVIKSLKIIRILRFMKIFRLLRLTKIQSILKILSESEVKLIYKFLKTNQGYLDLLKNMGYILLMAHYFSILYKVLSDNMICNMQEKCWIEEQNDFLASENVGDQNQLVQEHIKTALGMGAMIVQNDFEVQLNVLWMLIGLSLFGQGIGNISSYLNYANKQDLEFAETLNQFNELCVMNNIDPRLQKLVISNIELNQSKFMDKELQNQASSLSSHIFEQLEVSLLEDFIHQQKLFEKLNLRTIRLIKSQMIIDHQKMIMRSNSHFKQLQFIMEGSVNIHNSNMSVEIVNQYSQDEIQGLNEFQKFINDKYKINIEKILQNHIDKMEKKTKSFLSNKLANKFKSIKIDKSENPLSKNISSNKKNDYQSLFKEFEEEFEEIGAQFKQIVRINEDFLPYELNAIASDDVKQMMIPFQTIEEILFTDVDSFLLIHRY